jgi:hypothetical protein
MDPIFLPSQEVIFPIENTNGSPPCMQRNPLNWPLEAPNINQVATQLIKFHGSNKKRIEMII